MHESCFPFRCAQRNPETKEGIGDVHTSEACFLFYTFYRHLSPVITHKRNTDTEKLGCLAANVPALEVGGSSAAGEDEHTTPGRFGSTASRGKPFVTKRDQQIGNDISKT